MTAIAVYVVLMGTPTQPPTSGALAELLEAANKAPPQMSGRSLETIRHGENGSQPETVVARSHTTFGYDGPKGVNTVTWEVKAGPFEHMVDYVRGRNDTYEFALDRLTPNAKWGVAAVGSNITDRSRVMFTAERWFSEAVMIDDTRLLTLLSDDSFRTEILPAPLGRCLVDGRSVNEQLGLRRFLVTLRVTPRYAYIETATCEFARANDRIDRIELTNVVREETVPVVVRSRSSTSVSWPDGRQYRIETESERELSFNPESISGGFSLKDYGLPEPAPSIAGDVPASLPPRDSSTFTWILLLPLFGILLLIVGRWLSRKGLAGKSKE